MWSLPLLALYCALVYLRRDASPKDEITYLTYAANLLQGHFAPRGTEFLWCGPGYPLALTPFVAAFGEPTMEIKLANAGFLWLAVVVFYRTLRLHLDATRATWIALASGLYWPFFDELPRVMSEPFTVFVVTLALHAAARFFATPSRTWMVATGLALAYLAMTKVIFGYVLLAALLLALLVWLKTRTTLHRRTAAALGLALALCTPWLGYTFWLTGKPFVWATSGGMQLYWMSTPHEEERGDWINYVLAAKFNATQANPVVRRHGAVFANAFGYDGVFEEEPWNRMVQRLDTRQDAVMQKAALDNIAQHPGKFARNWLSNVSRMLTDAPYSYRDVQRFWQFGVPNALLLLLLIRGGLRGGLRGGRARIPGLRPVLTFALLYLGGSSLLAAYPRQFYIVVPILAWCGARLWSQRAVPPDDTDGSVVSDIPDGPGQSSTSSA